MELHDAGAAARVGDEVRLPNAEVHQQRVQVFGARRLRRIDAASRIDFIGGSPSRRSSAQTTTRGPAPAGSSRRSTTDRRTRSADWLAELRDVIGADGFDLLHADEIAEHVGRPLYVHADIERRGVAIEANIVALQEALLEHHLSFDALFCASDLIAIGAMRALVDRRISAPHDVAVAGFDDIPIASFTIPA